MNLQGMSMVVLRVADFVRQYRAELLVRKFLQEFHGFNFRTNEDCRIKESVPSYKCYGNT